MAYSQNTNFIQTIAGVLNLKNLNQFYKIIKIIPGSGNPVSADGVNEVGCPPITPRPVDLDRIGPGGATVLPFTVTSPYQGEAGPAGDVRRKLARPIMNITLEFRNYPFSISAKDNDEIVYELNSISRNIPQQTNIQHQDMHISFHNNIAGLGRTHILVGINPAQDQVDIYFRRINVGVAGNLKGTILIDFRNNMGIFRNPVLNPLLTNLTQFLLNELSQIDDILFRLYYLGLANSNILVVPPVHPISLVKDNVDTILYSLGIQPQNYPVKSDEEIKRMVLSLYTKVTSNGITHANAILYINSNIVGRRNYLDEALHDRRLKLNEVKVIIDNINILHTESNTRYADINEKYNEVHRINTANDRKINQAKLFIMEQTIKK